MSPPRGRLWLPIAIAAACAMAVATLGAFVTDLGPWYAQLRKPSWQPPDWLFGPVWTLIFGLTALSAVSAWRRSSSQSARTRVIWMFAINAALNLAWSILFFRLHRPDWALAEVGFLWLSISIPVWVLARYAKPASWLLLPYLAWVSFAAFLNWTVVRLNSPFG